MTVIVVACLAFAFVMAGPVQAQTDPSGNAFSGSAFFSYGTFNSVIVTTSSNVFMLYQGDPTSAQSYGAYTKNAAGDKFYATGGGQGASTGIYYMQNSSWVGSSRFTGTIPSTPSMFVTTSGDGWTAQ